MGEIVKLGPDVRFAGRRGLILSDDSAEHWLYNPTLETMLRRYLRHLESRHYVRQWIDETQPSSPYGFVALCEYLDLDPNYVRRGLTRWMDNVDDGRFADNRVPSDLRDWSSLSRRTSEKLRFL
jgi:hypothetical protein